MKQIFTLLTGILLPFSNNLKAKTFALLMILASLTTYAQSGTGSGSSTTVIPELIFENPVLISGTDKQEGAIYRFNNVAAGVDALLEIKKVSDASTVINNLDNTAFGWNKAFQPEMGRNGDIAANQEWWIRYQISFLTAGTDNRMKLSKFYITAIDVDGDGQSVQEFVQMQNADSIALSTFSALNLISPIDCGMSNTLNDLQTLGPLQNFVNIDTAGTAVMATYTFINQDTVDFTIGGRSGLLTSNAAMRLNSLWFKAFSLAPPISVLPLKLVSFHGNVTNKKATLQWAVAENETGYSFELQRSDDGINFKTAALIFTTDKNGDENYSYTESKEITSTNFYRLKMINKDNTITYSKLLRLSAKNDNVDKMKLMQNPVETALNFMYTTDADVSSTISVYNLSGAKLITKQMHSNKGVNTISVDLPATMQAAVYIVEVANNQGKTSARFIKK